MNDLMTRLDETLVEMVETKINEKVCSLDFADEARNEVEEVVRNFDLDPAIERALEHYDFDHVIGNAVDDFDFSDDAEKAVATAVENLELDDIIGERIDQLLDKKLPSAIERNFLALLEKPEFAEKLVKLLFDRAGE